MNGEDPLWRMGRVDFSGAIKEVSLACAPEAKVGDFVLVHAGLAISVLDEEEARTMIDAVRQLGGEPE